MNVSDVNTSNFYPLNKLFVEGEIRKGQIILFIGPPGAGKTHLALKIAISHITQSDAVLYYLLEEGLETIKERYELLKGPLECFEEVFICRKLNNLRMFNILKETIEDLSKKETKSLLIIDSFQSYINVGKEKEARELFDFLRGIAVKSSINIILISERQTISNHDGIDMGFLADMVVKFDFVNDQIPLHLNRFLRKVIVTKARAQWPLPYESTLLIEKTKVDIILPVFLKQELISNRKHISIGDPIFSIGISKVDELHFKNGSLQPRTVLLEGPPHTQKSQITVCAFLANASYEQIKLPEKVLWITIERPVNSMAQRIKDFLEKVDDDYYAENPLVEDIAKYFKYLSPQLQIDLFMEKIENFLFDDNGTLKYRKVILSDLEHLSEFHDSASVSVFLRYLSTLSKVHGFTLFVVNSTDTDFSTDFSKEDQIYRYFDTVLQCNYIQTANQHIRKLTLHIVKAPTPIQPDELFFDCTITNKRPFVEFSDKQDQIFDHHSKRFEIGDCSIYLFNFSFKSQCQTNGSLPGIFEEMKKRRFDFRQELIHQRIDIKEISREDKLDFYHNITSLHGRPFTKTAVFTYDEPWLHDMKQISVPITPPEEFSSSIVYDGLSDECRFALPYVATHSCLLIHSQEYTNKSQSSDSFRTWEELKKQCFKDNSKITLYVLGENGNGLANLFLQSSWNWLFGNSGTQLYINPDLNKLSYIKKIYDGINSIKTLFEVIPINNFNKLMEDRGNWLLLCWLNDVLYLREFINNPNYWDNHFTMSLIPQTSIEESKNNPAPICLVGDWYLSVLDGSANSKLGISISREISEFMINHYGGKIGLPLLPCLLEKEQDPLLINSYNIFRNSRNCQRRSSIQDFIYIQTNLLHDIGILMAEKKINLEWLQIRFNTVIDHLKRKY